VEAQESHSSHFPTTGICGQGKAVEPDVSLPPKKVNAVSGYVCRLKFEIVCIHIWEEHLLWYYSSVDYTKGFIVVKISIIHHILYFYFKTFVTGRLKSNLLSPRKLLVPSASNLKGGQ
jgi:hypothetical protein